MLRSSREQVAWTEEPLMSKVKKKDEHLFQVFFLCYHFTFPLFHHLFHYFLCTGTFLVLDSWWLLCGTERTWTRAGDTVSKSTAYWLVTLGLVFPPGKNTDMCMFNECYYCCLWGRGLRTWALDQATQAHIQAPWLSSWPLSELMNLSCLSYCIWHMKITKAIP